MSWQDDFTAYTTGWAFNLALSHDQASLLAHIGAGYRFGEWESRTGRQTFIPTFRALERRGLAEHNQLAKAPGPLPPHAKLKWIYRLTPAGSATLELLRLAGVVPAAEAKSEAA